MSRHCKDERLLLEYSFQIPVGVHLEEVLYLLPVNLLLSATFNVDVQTGILCYLEENWPEENLHFIIHAIYHMMESERMRETWHKWWIQPWPHHTRGRCCEAHTKTFRSREKKKKMKNLSGSTTCFVLPLFSWHTLANRVCLVSCCSSQVPRDEPSLVQANIGLSVQCLLNSKWRRKRKPVKKRRRATWGDRETNIISSSPCKTSSFVWANNHIWKLFFEKQFSTYLTKPFSPSKTRRLHSKHMAGLNQAGVTHWFLWEANISATLNKI